MKTSIATITLLASIFLTSCSEDRTVSTPLPTASEALSKVFSSVQDTPVSILNARATAKPGDTLTLKGVVMGSTKPFVEGRAAFILGDPEKLTPCNQNPDDHCKTPWDVCCETPEDIKAATVTIQVVDADGKVLQEPIENVNGLKPLSKVIVSGTVASSSNADLLILNARFLQVSE